MTNPVNNSPSQSSENQGQPTTYIAPRAMYYQDANGTNRLFEIGQGREGLSYAHANIPGAITCIAPPAMKVQTTRPEKKLSKRSVIRIYDDSKSITKPIAKQIKTLLNSKKITREIAEPLYKSLKDSPKEIDLKSASQDELVHLLPLLAKMDVEIVIDANKLFEGHMKALGTVDNKKAKLVFEGLNFFQICKLTGQQKWTAESLQILESVS